MPGRPLKELWHSLSFSAKTSLVGEFAAYSSCLFQNQLQGIGNLYRAALNDSTLSEATWPAGNPAYSNHSPLSEKEHLHTGLPDVGRIVSMHFFFGGGGGGGGGHISFRMFIEGHLHLAVSGLHHVFLSVRKTVSRH